jgi:hypothetical protein
MERILVKSRIVSVAAICSAALIPAAHGARPQTTVPDVFVTIHVTITDSKIALDRHSAGRGDEVRWAIRNIGKKIHTFTLGHTKRQSGSQTGFSATLKPRQEKLFLLYLDYRGLLPYRSILSHDANKPGMKGIFKIL